jgi:hypothetical protein
MRDEKLEEATQGNKERNKPTNSGIEECCDMRRTKQSRAPSLGKKGYK